MDLEGDFSDYVAARSRALLRTAYLLTGDWHRAQDLVQTSLERCWPRWRRVRAGGDPDAYVRRAMLNTFRSDARRRWRGEVPTGEPPEHAQVGDAHAVVELRHALLAAVLGLPPRQRSVLVLRFFDDLTEAQTAAALCCGVGTVKSSASRALAALRADPQLAGLTLEATP